MTTQPLIDDPTAVTPLDLSRSQRALEGLKTVRLSGRVAQVVGLTIEARGLDCQIGEVCDIRMGAPIQRGPGARGLYILEKWTAIRYTRRDRMIAYRRAFNYGTAPTPTGAVVNRSFHYQFVAFMSAMSQYFRDYTIGQVIRGSGTIDDRPFASLATIQRVGTDLRFNLDRASYGNILALTQEVGQYVQQILELFDTPDIKKSFDANTKWDVLEAVSNRHLGGAAELSQRSKMAESGRRILQFIADNDFRTDIDIELFHADSRASGAQAEAWIADRLGSGGTPELLWVRQGELALEPEARGALADWDTPEDVRLTEG